MEKVSIYTTCLQNGNRHDLPLTGTYKGVVGKLPTVGETLIDLIPGNIFKAMEAGRFDQVVIMSAFVGVNH